MNSKGFTLVELLGTIVILGFLSIIAIVSVNSYITSSRYKAYKTMSQSVYQAAENCTVNGECDIPDEFNNSRYIKVDELVSSGYLTSLKNPISNNDDCYGGVTITYNNSTSEYKKYSYEVKLTCPNYKPRVNGKVVDTLTWPDAKESE